MDNENMRSGDTDLLKQLHINFTKHIERFNAHEKKEADKFNMMIQGQQANIEAISELTKQVSILVLDTKDIIKLYRDAQGVVRIGVGAQAVLLWLAKWGALGAAISVCATYLIQNTKP